MLFLSGSKDQPDGDVDARVRTSAGAANCLPADDRLVLSIQFTFFLHTFLEFPQQTRCGSSNFVCDAKLRSLHILRYK